MYKAASMTRRIYVTRNDFNVNNRNTSAQICSRSVRRREKIARPESWCTG